MIRLSRTLAVFGAIALLASPVFAQEEPSMGYFTPRGFLWMMGVPNQGPGVSWAKFGVGSWVKVGGSPFAAMGQMKRTLKSKTADEVVIVVEWELSKERLEELEKQRKQLEKQLGKREAPHLSPKPKEETLPLKSGPPKEEVKLSRTYKDKATVAGRSFACTVYEFTGDEGGKGKAWTSDAMPGGLVKMEGTDEKGKKISTTLRGEEVTIAGKKVDCLVLTLSEPEGTMEFWLSASVPGESVKLVGVSEEGKEEVIFEVTDFEVKK